MDEVSQFCLRSGQLSAASFSAFFPGPVALFGISHSDSCAACSFPRTQQVERFHLIPPLPPSDPYPGDTAPGRGGGSKALQWFPHLAPIDITPTKFRCDLRAPFFLRGSFLELSKSVHAPGALRRSRVFARDSRFGQVICVFELIVKGAAPARFHGALRNIFLREL